MSKNPTEYLKHIRDEIAYIQSVVEPGLTKEELLTDETL